MRSFYIKAKRDAYFYSPGFYKKSINVRIRNFKDRICAISTQFANLAEYCFVRSAVRYKEHFFALPCV